MVDVIRFRFELTPLGQVQPWGADRRLHWFALTDGVYWIDLAGSELLRYAVDIQNPAGPAHTFVDYYVARFWEDVLTWTPAVLEPAPPDLVWFVASDQEQWAPNECDEAAAAKVWHDDHALDLGYLRNPPRIRAWRTIVDGADRITVVWRHRSDGDIRFTAPEGTATMTTDEFRRAVADFNRDLMTAMAERVEVVMHTGPPPGVTVDVKELRTEQAQRSTRHSVSLARRSETDWPLVRAGAHHLRADRP
jgi:hypothetical protein